ncbi:unnamed protein product [Cylicocyclus nassatus]|uniref:Uncharacterized protein n=1 Tax=Cylicocyclus nassatus TaxID=53992 RepID=A0AA36DSX6_CYLNA|nr:unnamed protein product [Cylicocyclus nassatus]
MVIADAVEDALEEGALVAEFEYNAALSAKFVDAKTRLERDNYGKGFEPYDNLVALEASILEQCPKFTELHNNIVNAVRKLDVEGQAGVHGGKRLEGDEEDYLELVELQKRIYNQCPDFKELREKYKNTPTWGEELTNGFAYMDWVDGETNARKEK